MLIESVKAVYPNYANVVSSWRTHLWQIVVEVRTDTGSSVMDTAEGDWHHCPS